MNSKSLRSVSASPERDGASAAASQHSVETLATEPPRALNCTAAKDLGSPGQKPKNRPKSRINPATNPDSSSFRSARSVLPCGWRGSADAFRGRRVVYRDRVKSALRSAIAALLGSVAVTGCTALLGSFEVTGAAGPELLDGQAGGDAPVAVDGSATDGAAVDGFVPPVCKGAEIACGKDCAIIATSGDHCGKCGHSCGGGECKAGVCQPVQLLTSTSLVGSIAVNDLTLFFATDDMKLSSCPKSGCKLAPKQLAAMTYPIRSVVAVQKDTVVFESAPTQTTERPNLYACQPSAARRPLSRSPRTGSAASTSTSASSTTGSSTIRRAPVSAGRRAPTARARRPTGSAR